MAAAFLDFENTADLAGAVKRGEAPPPSALRKKGGKHEPVWSRIYLERFSAPSIVVSATEADNESLETLL